MSGSAGTTTTTIRYGDQVTTHDTNYIGTVVEVSADRNDKGWASVLVAWPNGVTNWNFSYYLVTLPPV